MGFNNLILPKCDFNVNRKSCQDGLSQLQNKPISLKPEPYFSMAQLNSALPGIHKHGFATTNKPIISNTTPSLLIYTRLFTWYIRSV